MTPGRSARGMTDAGSDGVAVNGRLLTEAVLDEIVFRMETYDDFDGGVWYFGDSMLEESE